MHQAETGMGFRPRTGRQRCSHGKPGDMNGSTDRQVAGRPASSTRGSRKRDVPTELEGNDRNRLRTVGAGKHPTSIDHRVREASIRSCALFEQAGQSRPGSIKYPAPDGRESLARLLGNVSHDTGRVEFWGWKESISFS